jgi:hypothetical protein
MRGTAPHRLPKVRSPKPLVVRAGLGRTFGSLIGFLALLFLSWGIYLLADAFAHPVDAQAAALVVAALAISLAMLLLFYLFKPRRVVGMNHRQPLEDSATPTAEPLSRAPSVTACREDLHKDQAYQRVYVDRSRIRP